MPKLTFIISQYELYARDVFVSAETAADAVVGYMNGTKTPLRESDTAELLEVPTDRGLRADPDQPALAKLIAEAEQRGVLLDDGALPSVENVLVEVYVLRTGASPGLRYYFGNGVWGDLAEAAVFPNSSGNFLPRKSIEQGAWEALHVSLDDPRLIRMQNWLTQAETADVSQKEARSPAETEELRRLEDRLQLRLSNMSKEDRMAIIGYLACQSDVAGQVSADRIAAELLCGL